MVDTVLQRLSPRFDAMYAEGGRPSIAPEKLLRALLLKCLCSLRSEHLLKEQLDYNLLFRWFVGLNMDEALRLGELTETPGAISRTSALMGEFRPSG